MPKTNVVPDLEFVALNSLFSVRDFTSRKAYWSGLLTGLKIAKAYSEAEVLNPDLELPKLLGEEGNKLETRVFVETLKAFTSANLAFSVQDVINPGLRRGKPGKYYAMGLSDAGRIGINQVPLFFKNLYNKTWKKKTLEWTETKLMWAWGHLKIEDARNKDFIF